MGISGAVAGVLVASDRRYIVSCSKDGGIKIWEFLGPDTNGNKNRIMKKNSKFNLFDSRKKMVAGEGMGTKEAGL